MRILSILAFFSITFFVLYPPKISSYFVVTKFDLRTIGDYFLELKKYTNGEIGQFSNKELNSFCHVLRKSCNFYPANTTAEIQESDNETYLITQEELRAEKKQVISELPLLSLRVKQSEKIQKLPAFTCLDRNKEASWFITPAFMPDSAFLFEMYPNFKRVSQSVVLGQHKIFPQLTAVVDKQSLGVVDETTENNPDLGNERFLRRFMRFMSRVPKDPLCDLKPMMKYRLCAIVVGNLHRPVTYNHVKDSRSSESDESDNIDTNTNIEHEGNENESNDGSVNEYDSTDQSYGNPFSNIYYPQEDPDKTCQQPVLNLPDISPTPTVIPRKMLYCSISMNRREWKYNFYLSQHPRKLERVFLLYQYRNYTALVTKVEVPLLKHIPHYKDIFYDSRPAK